MTTFTDLDDGKASAETKAQAYQAMLMIAQGAIPQWEELRALVKHHLTLKRELTAQVPAWTAVKDRRPEKSGPVLVTTHFVTTDGKMSDPAGDVAWYVGEPWPQFTGIELHGLDWRDGGETKVTHWMPLPKFPEAT